MSTYTDELKAELDRVTIKGSPDKHSFSKLASIIWRLDQRLQILEEQIYSRSLVPNKSLEARVLTKEKNRNREEGGIREEGIQHGGGRNQA